MAFSTLAQFGIGHGWDAVILGIINLVNLTISTLNNRRLNKVREEQKSVAADLLNGGSPLLPRQNGKNGKEVK
jgi:hypothetical protein